MAFAPVCSLSQTRKTGALSLPQASTRQRVLIPLPSIPAGKGVGPAASLSLWLVPGNTAHPLTRQIAHSDIAACKLKRIEQQESSILECNAYQSNFETRRVLRLKPNPTKATNSKSSRPASCCPFETVQPPLEEFNVTVGVFVDGVVALPPLLAASTPWATRRER